jgi:hypothetical protein
MRQASAIFKMIAVVSDRTRPPDNSRGSSDRRPMLAKNTDNICARLTLPLLAKGERQMKTYPM